MFLLLFSGGLGSLWLTLTEHFSQREILFYWEIVPGWTYQHACVSPQKVVKVNNTSQHNICLKQCHTLWWRKTLPRATLVFPVLGSAEWRKPLCSNSSLAPGHTHPVCHPLICLACHFIIHIECCGSMAGRSWIISQTMGDSQMTGQSVWWEQAHRKGKNLIYQSCMEILPNWK